MKRFLLKPNPGKDENLRGTKSAAADLLRLGAELFMEETYKSFGVIDGVQYCSKEQAEQSAQGVLVFGGDGTLLRAAHETNLPLLGINFGNLGFITELKKGEIQLFSHLLEDKFRIESRLMLKCVRVRDGVCSEQFYALNDVVTSRGIGDSMMQMDLLIDGCFVDTYRADGIIVTTPTGSTAYALSAGGAILEPEAEAMEIIAICPHMLRTRPLVVSAKRKITLIPLKGSSHVVADGRELYDMNAGDRLEICQAEKRTRLIRVHSRSFYDILHEKLGSDQT